MENLNSLDIFIGIILFLMGTKGYIHGFFRELLGFAGIIFGFSLASRFSPVVSTFISENIVFIENKTLLTMVGFFAILAIVWFSVMSLGSILSKLTTASGLGFVNNIFGFILGGGKYFVIFAVMITALSNVSLLKETLNKYTSDSIFAPYLLATGSYMINLDPKEISIGGIKPSSDILRDENKTEQERL